MEMKNKSSSSKTKLLYITKVCESETNFQETLKKELNGIEFIDFSKFELSNDEFRDFDHLNYKGAIKFSKHFNNFLNSNF